MASSNIDVYKEIMRGSVDLTRHKVFYGHILQQLTKVFHGERWGIPTMGVGKEAGDLLVKLYINDAWVKSIWERAKSAEQAQQWLGGVLEHEVLHLVFDHLSLRFSDEKRGQMAMDCVVNSCINRQNLMPDACTPELWGLEPNKSAMWYYTHLPVKPGKGGSGGGKGKGKGKGKQGNGKGEGQNGQGGGENGDWGSHEMWKKAMQDPLLKEFCKDIIRKAKNLIEGKNYGNIPGHVIEQIDNLLGKKKPIIPWNKVLRNFAASATESNLDYTMKRISKRFGTRPGTRKEDVLNLAVAVDTSGSISDKQLVMFFNEIRWIWKNGAFVTVFEADARVCAVYPFKGKFTGNVHGRGGTDLEPVLKDVVGKYDALIYFTDFYAPVINTRYNIPILWVLTTELTRDQFPYKWGKHIKIEGNRAMVA